jgi:hypothetical protein
MSWLVYDKQVRKDIETGAITWGKLHYEYWVLATTAKQQGPSHNFRANSQYNTKGGSFIGKKKSQEDFASHSIGSENAPLTDASLNTLATCVESHTQFTNVQGKNKQAGNMGLLNGSTTAHNLAYLNRSIITPVKPKILEQFLEGYDNSAKLFYRRFSLAV